MLEIQKAKNKLLKFLDKACVGCGHSSINIWGGGLKCYLGSNFKCVKAEHKCKKFEFSEYRIESIKKLFIKFPKLRKDEELVALAKKSKVKI